MKPKRQQKQQQKVTGDLVQSVRMHLLTLPRGAKQASMIATDAFCYAVSAVAAIWLIAGSEALHPATAYIAVLAVAIGVPVHWAFGLYASIVRYMGLALMVTGLKSTLVVTSLVVAVTHFAGFTASPVRVGIVFGAFALILIVGGRVAARMFLSRRNRNREQVIIFGAGEGGAQLVASLLSGDDYFPVAMVDDNVGLQGKRIHGLQVHPPDRLERLIETTQASGVLLAIPSASRRSRRQVLERLSEFPVHVQTMPEIKDIVSGRARVDDIRDVDVKDLLGRDPVPPRPVLLRASTTGKSVMITGAAGSIGSELCRQILDLNPEQLILLEMSEAALYDVDRELTKKKMQIGATTEIVPLLGSVHHEHRVREIINQFDVQTIYHAAAYKHVPIVEHNLFEGIHNNVFGTLHTARAAIECGIETFVLISTDKAVNPTNVMGATKRMAELVLQALNSESSTRTRCCMVRFGNVLESSGSVVPLFKEQIRLGGPVTVTHRDIIRYFMTIPEAAQLVIQAAALAEGGDVFVLDMGKPVKISDLAHRMISLMGLTVQDKDNPDGDIEIEFIGLRPAEKLFEELLIGSNVSGTKHPRIMKAEEDFLSLDVLQQILASLRQASDQLDYETARSILVSAVNEYEPTNGIDDLLWKRKAEAADRIIEFPARPRPA